MSVAEGVIDRVGFRVDVGKALGIASIILGLAAFWVALPPLTTRSAAVPLVLGVAGIAAGLWSWRHGHLRLGWSGVMIALLGMLGGVLATRAAVGNLEVVITWSALTAATLRFATPLVFASIGGLFSERSGVVNIGLEGMMLMGAFFGIYGADRTNSWVAGILIGMAAGAALALVHAFFSIHLRADQIVNGTAINFLALGLTGYLYIDLYGTEGTGDVPAVPDVHLNFLDRIPPEGLGNYLDRAFGQLNLMIWLALLTVVLAYVVIFRTTVGLRIRSVGEHPQGRGHGRHLRLCDPVCRGRHVRRAGGARRRLPLDRVRPLLHGEHDRRTRVHRARGADLRPLAPVRRTRGGAPLRLRQRGRAAPRERRELGDLRHALPDASVRAHPDRRGRLDRALDPARCHWSTLREAVTRTLRPR